MFQSGVEFNQQLGGWIEVVCGPMFSGKTEELIRRMRRAQIAGQKIEIFKLKRLFSLFVLQFHPKFV